MIRLLYIRYLRQKALSGSRILSSSHHSKINMLHLTLLVSRSVETLPRIPKREVPTSKWWTTSLVSAPIWTPYIDLMLTLILKRPILIAWLVELHIFCSLKMKSWWKWWSVDTNAFLAELIINMHIFNNN